MTPLSTHKSNNFRETLKNESYYVSSLIVNVWHILEHKFVNITVQLHTPYSTMATSALLRFQQQQQKSAATHAQMLVNTPGILQNLGSAGVGTALSLGLKSFHNPTMNMQNFTPSPLSVRFPTLKTHAHHLLDIPMSTASLMNHHREHHPHQVTQTSSHAVGSNASTQLQLTTTNRSNGCMNNSNNNGTSVGVGNSSGGGKRKRSWSRAVFSNLQRKGLEIQFQQQKYITKPDRRKLAARLNLTDAQVGKDVNISTLCIFKVF